MRKPLLFAVLTLTASLISVPAARAQGGGFFNFRCEFSHAATEDPIVEPGDHHTEHLHDFIANRSTGADSSRASMLQARTTCALSKDTSGYWVPALLDRSGNHVAIAKVLVYYRSKAGMTVRPFPANLKMIAGGDTANPPAPSRSQRSLSWACGDTAPYTASPPDCSGTGQHVTAHVHFPDCWDGAHTDSADHRSHMTWGSPECPSGYVAVPRLRLHIEYAATNARGFTLVSDMGMPSGHSLHADFWNTWNQNALSFLVDRCLNGGRSCSMMTDAKLASMGF
jgi:hypothetical protein